MYKWFRRQFPILLSVCLLSGTSLPVSSAQRCSNADPFQISLGSSGRDGRTGKSGSDRTVFATGEPLNLNLSGEDGSDGEDGSNGSHPTCSSHHEDDENVQLPSGGSGGDGGDGGNGGNGGILTLYYRDLNQLQQILVRAEGGRGGQGGQGGDGKPGCQCRRSHWTKKVCTGKPGTPEHKCETKEYTCTDGTDGTDGSHGSRGQNGSLGKLRIVKREAALPDDRPSITLPLPQIKETPLKLSRNLWESKTGALSLLAPGSVIENRYESFLEQIEGEFQLVWATRQPIRQFADLPATVTLNQDRQIQVSFASELWINATQTQQGNSLVFKITDLVRESDVKKLAVADVAQSGKNLSLSIVDLGGNAAVLTTEFQLRYRAKSSNDGDRFSAYQTYYNGTIPSDRITRDYNRFIVQLGQLPIPAEFLESKTEVEIELVAKRSLSGRSAKQKITWQGQLRG